MEKLNIVTDDLTEGLDLPAGEKKKRKNKKKKAQNKGKKGNSNNTGTKEDTLRKSDDRKECFGDASGSSKTCFDKSKSNGSDSLHAENSFDDFSEDQESSKKFEVATKKASGNSFGAAKAPFGQSGNLSSTSSRPKGDRPRDTKSHATGSIAAHGTSPQVRGNSLRSPNAQIHQQPFKGRSNLRSICSHTFHDDDCQECYQKVRYSKKLSNILRHRAHDMGFQMDAAGYILVDEILEHSNFRGVSQAYIKAIVQADAKQRFSLKGEGRDLKICANQGHTFEVEELEIKEITDASDYDIVVHGTYYDAWKQIKETGLNRMKRQHIHFCMGEPGDKKIISGARQSANVLIYINMAKALADGFKFYCSQNNVILCPGNKDGILPPKYFRAVKDRYKGCLLQQIQS